MASVYSDQYQNSYISVPVAAAKSNENGKVRAKYFNLNTTADPINSGDTVFLCKLPAGARIVGGSIAFGAMGASATLAIGVSGTTGKYLGATSVTAAGKAAIADTVALSHGDELTAETTIIGTAAGANFAAAQDIRGEILYVVD